MKNILRLNALIPLIVLVLALPDLARAVTIDTNLQEFSCARLTLLDTENYKYERGNLTSSGFVPIAVNQSLALTTLGYTLAEVSAISGKVVAQLSLWTSFKDQETQAGYPILGNFERSDTVYYVGGVPYVILRYTAGGNGTTFDPGAPAANPNGLVNLSCRAVVPVGGQIIPGFVLTSTTTVLVRAGGPALAAYGVPGTLANPTLRLFAGNTQMAFNDDWGNQVSSGSYTTTNAAVAAAFTKTGASAYSAGSTDAALLITLPAGVYSAFVEGTQGTGGEVLFEVYQVPN